MLFKWKRFIIIAAGRYYHWNKKTNIGCGHYARINLNDGSGYLITFGTWQQPIRSKLIYITRSWFSYFLRTTRNVDC